MKKTFTAFFLALQIGSWQSIYSETVSFVVPKQSLTNKSSLVLLMLDGLGNQCVGTCQLDEALAYKTIRENDLCIKSDDSFQELSTSIAQSQDVTYTPKSCEHEVVLYFELEPELQVLRVLVVKGNFFEEDPFNIYAIPLEKQGMANNQQEEVDELSMLLDTINVDEAEPVTQQENSLLRQYSLYAQIFFMMQYEHTKRKVNELMSWLYDRK